MWSFTNDSKDSASPPQIITRYFRKINVVGIKYSRQIKFKPDESTSGVHPLKGRGLDEIGNLEDEQNCSNPGFNFSFRR